MLSMFISVYIEHNALRSSFTYRCDEPVQVACRVLVPFGVHTYIGFVEAIDVECNLDHVKSVIEVIDSFPLLNEELIQLAKTMSKKYICSEMSCFKVMLPDALKPKSNYSHVVYEDWVVDYTLNDDLTARQKELLQSLSLPIKVSEFRKLSRSITKKLMDSHVVTIEQRVKSSELLHYDICDSCFELTDEQKSAISYIQNSDRSIFLLHGVTGSGKTEVFLQLAKNVLDAGKQVLFLVPEIGLTPMMIQRVKARFKKRIAIYHSGLNAQEKYEQYMLVKEDKVDIVVGTRSACFMPFHDLGLILMDEEHDTSYKQDSMPRYHTRDIVFERMKYHHCKVVLASATPSLESYARAYKGVYGLVSLKNRIHDLPNIQLIDMKQESVQNGLSLKLIAAIQSRLDRHEQVILLLNRRGYLPVLRCMDCGSVRVCPDCGVSLSYHKKENMLMCHCCGRMFAFVEECPDCHSHAYSKSGMGTEKLEEQICTLFSDAHIVRMDADSTRKKNAHMKLLKTFEESGDILLGTQMVAKGLDFERVTLVGILNADAALTRTDYRASELAYSMLEQASGRSGRGKLRGEVMIQTFDPDHYVMQCVLKHDYELFFRKEMQYRHLGQYPPYVFMCSLIFSHKDLEIAYQLANDAKSSFLNCKVLGPTEIHKLNQKCRVRLIIKCKDDDYLRLLVDRFVSSSKVFVDVNMHPMVLED